jgi:hypothetical protein
MSSRVLLYSDFGVPSNEWGKGTMIAVVAVHHY